MEKYNQDARLLHFSSLAAQRPNVSPYAFSKWHSEEILRQMDNTLQWTLFRPSVVYGPGDTEVIPLLKWMRVGFFPIVGKAENRFSMLHVHDLARAVVTWIKSENCNSATYELHDGKINGYSWREIIQTMSWLYGKHIKPFHVPVSFVYSCAYLNIAVHGILGKKPMFSPGKVCELLQSGWVCDNAYFTKHTGWRPEIDLEKGVRELAGGRMRTNEGNKS
jgi:nucleoside-diphosphate-sugar epimerase